MKRRKLWGWDVYLIGFVIIGVHLASIVAKFMGKDIGLSISESLNAISSQIEKVSLVYLSLRVQKQTNNSHQRITKITKVEGLEDAPK